MNLQDELRVAANAARRAGAMLAERFSDTAGDIRCKEGDPRELVSDADITADATIRAILEEAYPRDSILTEESPALSGSSGRRWMVDPLDGTTNFLAGIPCWAVSIGLEQDGEAVLATVYDAVRDELFQSTQGEANCNGAPIAVSAVEAIPYSVLSLLLQPSDLARPNVVALAERARGTREFGATALELAWVAAGRLDGCLFRRTASAWDWIAGERLVIDAGGVSLPWPLADAYFAAGVGLARAVVGRPDPIDSQSKEQAPDGSSNPHPDHLVHPR